jgi:hypothetical protein
VDIGYQVIGIGSDDRKGPNPFARYRLSPVLSNARKTERRAIHRGG